MPKAEVGSVKHVANQLKSKGLTRLRWYCQACNKANRDANAFKMHCQSESHVRNMVIIGEDSKKFIEDYSRQFQRDFMQLLKTGHGEKSIHIKYVPYLFFSYLVGVYSYGFVLTRLAANSTRNTSPTRSTST